MWKRGCYREANCGGNGARPSAGAIEYADHELLTNRFHVTHYGGCAVLFNKDTFFPDVKVKSIYLHDTRRELPDKVMERDSYWVLQGVLSRASFRRQRLSDQKTFQVLSLHISDTYAKKRGKGKKLILTIRAVMLDEKVDLVGSDFNGAAWRCDNRNNTNIIEKAFADCALPSIPGKWADVCGFLKPSESDRHWKVRLHGAFSILHEALGIRPTDQSCHHEAWLHLDFVGWHDEQLQREKHDRRILLKQLSALYHYGNQKWHISDFYERPFVAHVRECDVQRGPCVRPHQGAW